MKSILKPFLPKQLREYLKSYLKEKNTFKPKLELDVRRQLIEEYRDDILKLQELIQRDLSKWLEC